MVLLNLNPQWVSPAGFVTRGRDTVYIYGCCFRVEIYSSSLFRILPSTYQSLVIHNDGLIKYFKKLEGLP